MYPISSLGEKNLVLKWRLILKQFFREESIGEGFKIVTVAVFWENHPFREKNGSSLTVIFKPTRVCSYKIFSSKKKIADPLFPLLTY